MHPILICGLYYDCLCMLANQVLKSKFSVQIPFLKTESEFTNPAAIPILSLSTSIRIWHRRFGLNEIHVYHEWIINVYISS